jgi:hypothetical protein
MDLPRKVEALPADSERVSMPQSMKESAMPLAMRAASSGELLL